MSTFRTMLKSKIHRARVTDCNIDYEGSITIDSDLLKAADILPYEKVEILDINNGARFSTYAIEGEPGSGDICLNGAAARMVCLDDLVIILTYHEVPSDEAEKVKPRLVYVDRRNRITSVKNVDSWMDDLIAAR
ncbi:MAG: aspartate 1-decarboxylase [Dehalococcoidia bacterium]|nr:aspartate 1-decarboxylase [Dehalococcoidia bacterium]